MTPATTKLAVLPFANRNRLTQALGFVIGVALLIVSAKIQIPFWPVPLTMQSAVVLMLPCILGLGAGVGSVAVYLGLGAAGYPVFAHTATAGMGPAYFMGPTGGYLIGFVLAALAIGFIYENMKTRLNIVMLTGLMLSAHVIIFGAGVLWLAYGVPALGMQAAIATGLMPFLLGTVAKSVFAAMSVAALTRPASKS